MANTLETTETPLDYLGVATKISSSIGALGGLAYAFNKKKGFWGYVGFFMLGSLAGSLIG
jgi:hypothetical protein